MDFRNEQALSPQSLSKAAPNTALAIFLGWPGHRLRAQEELALGQPGFRSIPTTPFFPCHQGQQLHRNWSWLMHCCCRLEFFSQMKIDQEVLHFHSTLGPTDYIASPACHTSWVKGHQ